MKAKRVVPRSRANRDIASAVDHYRREVGTPKALAFVDALEHAFLQIGRHPAAGSSRYSEELDLMVLRHWPLAKYPYLVFYVEREDHIDVWRLLHAHSDIPKSLYARG